MATTYQKKCRRCNGTGIYAGRGECFNCRLAGTVTVTRYTAAEKAEILAVRTRRLEALHTIKARALELNGKVFMWDVENGFHRLEDSEPDRFAKMLNSLDAGRLDDVVCALHAYAN